MVNYYLTKEARTYNGGKIIYSKNVVGKIGLIHAKIIKLDYLLLPYTRIISKWIKDLNVDSKPKKVLEENMGSKISVISCSYIFSDISPQGRIEKQTNKQMGIKQTKVFSQQRKPSTKWKANH